MDDEDRLLVIRIADGDQHALNDLCARYGGELLNYLYWLTADRGLAEEIQQDTFYAVWRGAGSFAGTASVRSWIFGIGRRRTHDARRRAMLPVVHQEELEPLPAPDPLTEDLALARADIRDLIAAIAGLPLYHQEVLVLTFVRGLSYQELARLLDVPIGTVKSRLSNAKRALREAMRQREIEP